MSDSWKEACDDFGIECTTYSSAYNLFPDDEESADYFFGWYWYLFHGNNEETLKTLLLDDPEEKYRMRLMGWKDARGER